MCVCVEGWREDGQLRYTGLFVSEHSDSRERDSEGNYGRVFMCVGRGEGRLVNGGWPASEHWLIRE